MGVSADLVTAPVFKTGETPSTAFGGFDSHPLPFDLLPPLEIRGSLLFELHTTAPCEPMRQLAAPDFALALPSPAKSDRR